LLFYVEIWRTKLSADRFAEKLNLTLYPSTVSVLHHKISILTYRSPLDTYSLQLGLYEILCKKSTFGEWIIHVKTKCSTVAAAVLNLFLITSLNMPSSRHSLPSKYQIILCNISILNWVVGTWWDSKWRACWIVENLIIEPCVVIWYDYYYIQGPNIALKWFLLF